MEKVTIVMPTYNLEQFVGEALDSIFKQKTAYEYKILIADDASTDRTIEIIEEYINKYPNKIELLRSERNVGLLKNSNRAFAKVRSEYLALLDGDDYWTTDDYLEKHITFLEKHKDYTICGANTVRIKGEKVLNNVVPEECLGKSYDFNDYLKQRIPFVHTSSIVLRNVVYNNGLPKEYIQVEDTFENCACRGEDFRFLQHLEKGKLMVLPETVSCYRIHEKGIWSGASEINHVLIAMITYNFYDKYWGSLETDVFQRLMIKYYKQLMRCLLIEKRLDKQFTLEKADAWMLADFLKDISNRDIDWKLDNDEENGLWNKIKEKIAYMLYCRCRV